MMRINVGCGMSPTRGWRNFDSSPSLRLARIPGLPAVLEGLGLIGVAQRDFMRFLRDHDVEPGDAVRGLPVPDGVADVLYSSHMIEHLDRAGAAAFLREARRVLRPGGVLRLVVPDLRLRAERYLADGDADAFVASLDMDVPRPAGPAAWLRHVLVGARNHRWMYDGASLARLVEAHGFEDVTVVPAGVTRIPDPGPLDLRERDSESVYVEAARPAR